MIVNPYAESDPQGFTPNVDVAVRRPKASGGAKALFIVLCILSIGLFPLFWILPKRNYLNQMQIQANEAASGIDIQLTKRRDTLIKLFDATKGYLKHENQTLTDIARLRNININANTRNEASQNMSDTLGRMMLTFENYPQLKANQLVAGLMSSSDYIEREIAAARRTYNQVVSIFNQVIFTWPTIVIAKNYATMPMFAASKTEKQDVKFDF